MEGWESGEWEGKDQCPIQEGCFVIGNHADEITVSRFILYMSTA